ncbi:MAG: glycosyltransferase family 4 protein [Proteobacteria bacterium]|nr:glycosyltransferase family 4 protein [Pseudomonadota bacterium]
MKPIALIAAFPPPITGQSLAAELLRSGLRKAGIPLIELDLSEPIGGRSLVGRICQLAMLEIRLAIVCIRTPDVTVYLQLGHGKAALVRDLFFMATAAAFRRPCVAHVHGSGFRTALEGLPAPLRAVERRLVSKLKAAVVLSDSLRSMFSGIVPEDRIFVVDNGIDAEFVDYTRLAPPRAFTRDRFNVLFLSNFLKAKGFVTLLEAAAIADARHLPIHFTFVGAKIDGQSVDIDDFVRKEELTNVSVHPVVAGMDKHQAYQDADVFILPSYYEGQPLSILEAMFESLPIVTTRVGGIPEIFSDDETGVCYVSPDDAEQIVEVLSALEADPDRRRAMGSANLKVAQARFTPEKHIETMLRILTE